MKTKSQKLKYIQEFSEIPKNNDIFETKILMGMFIFSILAILTSINGFIESSIILYASLYFIGFIISLVFFIIFFSVIVDVGIIKDIQKFKTNYFKAIKKRNKYIQSFDHFEEYFNIAKELRGNYVEVTDENLDRLYANKIKANEEYKEGIRSTYIKANLS